MHPYCFWIVPLEERLRPAGPAQDLKLFEETPAEDVALVSQGPTHCQLKNRRSSPDRDKAEIRVEMYDMKKV